MADHIQLEILKQGSKEWNTWRVENNDVVIDLSKADLRRVNLKDANLFGANLSKSRLDDADLSEANLSNADLSFASCKKTNFNHAQFLKATLVGTYFLGASLSSAKLNGSNLYKANCMNAFLHDADLSDCNLEASDFFNAHLCGANLTHSILKKIDLRNADLTCADFKDADLGGANMFAANCNKTNFQNTNLTKSNLQNASFVETQLEQANVEGCTIYGLSAWGLKGKPKDQSNLIITPDGVAEITVDDLQVAQFIYLLLNNQNLRNVIDTITSKLVLILGRFTAERKDVLDALRNELRKLNFTPVLFDFDKPASKDVTGTIETLARMARFIVVDLTDPSSIPHELATLVPHLRTTPIQLIKLEGTTVYSMINDYIGSYKWLLGPYSYRNNKTLITDLANVIAPANKMAGELRQ